MRIGSVLEARALFERTVVCESAGIIVGFVSCEAKIVRSEHRANSEMPY
jgi:hypothetical protein